MMADPDFTALDTIETEGTALAVIEKDEPAQLARSRPAFDLMEGEEGLQAFEQADGGEQLEALGAHALNVFAEMEREHGSKPRPKDPVRRLDHDISGVGKLFGKLLGF